jgi:hypothetical protein
MRACRDQEQVVWSGSVRHDEPSNAGWSLAASQRPRGTGSQRIGAAARRGRVLRPLPRPITRLEPTALMLFGACAARLRAAAQPPLGNTALPRVLVTTNGLRMGNKSGAVVTKTHPTRYFIAKHPEIH